MPPKSRQKTSKSESAATAPIKIPRTGTKPVKGKAAAKSAKPAAAAATPAASPISEGQPAPAFKITRDGGATVSSADFRGKNLVIFFYPRADTPGCTLEAIDFTRRAGDFAKLDTAVLGVSADSQKLQEKFRNKHNLKIPLGADEEHTMLNTFGVWGEKSMYGRTFMGVLRTTVLIDKGGAIVKIWRNVKVEGHADDVLLEARSLAGKKAK